MMKAIVVDDERLALESVLSLLHKLEPQVEAAGFLKASHALDYLAEHPVDVALLDIEMGTINGITLAKQCKELCPQVNIIFVTGYEQYGVDALRLHASGYLMKPVRAEDLRAELDNLRHPLPVPTNKRVRLQTFGSFEVFVDGQPLRFTMAKCKECLAYLVDRRGACMTTAELAAVLWEDRPYDRTVQNNTHRVLSDLVKTLRGAAVENILVKTRRTVGINMEQVNCDYYSFLAGDLSGINAFRGEYMASYSWAEFTLAALSDVRQ